MSDFAAEHPFLDTARSAVLDIAPAAAALALTRRLGGGQTAQMLIPMAAAAGGMATERIIDPRPDIGVGMTLLGAAAGAAGALSSRRARRTDMQAYMRTSRQQRLAAAGGLHQDIMAQAPKGHEAEFKELADRAARTTRRIGPKTMYYVSAAPGALAGAGYGLVGDRLLANLKLKEQANDDNRRATAGQ